MCISRAFSKVNELSSCLSGTIIASQNARARLDIFSKRARAFVLAWCIAGIFGFSAWGMDSQLHSGLAPLPPLNQQWMGAAYQGIIGRISPKHVKNVKLLFLGEPIPAIVQKYGQNAGLYGYGGLVAVRKKSFLGLTTQSIRFYLVDASGNLIKLTNINEMEREIVTPEFYRVVITVTEEYKPNPNYDPSSTDEERDRRKSRGGWHGPSDWDSEPEFIWVPKEEKSIVPVLDMYQEERLNVFQKTRLDRLPVYQ